MGGDPETYLRKLEPGREIAASAVRGLAGALDALAAAGLVTVRMDGRVRKVKLTAAGVARRDPSAVILARLDELTARVERLERAAAATAPTPGGNVKDAVLGAVAELDARGRLGGLVPIPDVRAALRARGHADDRAVTEALVELEREWRIDLNVAQSPTAVADRDAGIERPGRGLLYYVSRR